MQELLSDDIPLKDRLLRNGFWMYLLSFIIAPAGYLIKLMVSRELSVEDLGLVYSIIGFIGLISSCNDLGLTEALQYYLPQYIIDKEYSKAKSILIITRIIQFIGAILIGGLLYTIAPWMAEHYFHSPQAGEILRIFCIYFLFINLFQVLQSVFTALQNVKLQYLTEALRLRTVVGCVAYLYFFDTINSYNFTIIWLISVILGVGIAGFLFYAHYKENILTAPFVWDAGLLKTQWSYAWKIMIGMQIGTIYSQIGQQFTIALLGPYEAGIWSNYMMFFTGIGIFTGPIMSYLFPLFTELYKKNEQTKILLMKRYLTRGVLFASISIALGGWLLSEPVAVAFLGEKFRMSGTLFKWTSLSFFCILLNSIYLNILAGAGYIQERVKIVTITCILGIAISYLGVKQGLFGLVIANSTTQVFLLAMCYAAISKYKLL